MGIEPTPAGPQPAVLPDYTTVTLAPVRIELTSWERKSHILPLDEEASYLTSFQNHLFINLTALLCPIIACSLVQYLSW
jgi:hypothetical protein